MAHGWFIVKDFDNFINATRAIVFNTFGKDDDQSSDISGLDPIPAHELEEFDRVLSYNESVLIAKEILRKQKHKLSQKERYLVSEEQYSELINALNHRMLGNILNGLVNKGLVETSFDEEANDFVFWVKNDKTENPETD